MCCVAAPHAEKPFCHLISKMDSCGLNASTSPPRIFSPSYDFLRITCLARADFSSAGSKPFNTAGKTSFPSSSMMSSTVLKPSPCTSFVSSPTQQRAATRITTARRTVKNTRAGKGWELDTPEKLWEIGGESWLPFKEFESPDYLDGTLPGDRSFDPFRLGESWGFPPDGAQDSASRLGWLLEGELYNGRVAMLAIVGCLTVELQGKGPWWEAPNLSNIPIAQFAVGVTAVHLVFALLEKKRLENWKEKGEAGHFGASPFDPVGLNSDYNRQAEVRNCRLAMLAFLGFATQAWVTGKGPIQNAADHLRAPFENNIFTQGDKGIQVALAFTVFSVAMHAAEAGRKPTGKSKRGGAYA